MSKKLVVRIGTYTDGWHPGRGIVTAQVAADGSRIEQAGVIEANEPSYVIAGPSGHTLYAVAEAGTGRLAAFSAATGGLLNDVGSGGADPCHLAVVGGLLAHVNYSSGSIAVHRLMDGDGAIGEQTCFVQHTGRGPVASRQDAAHPHMIAPVPGDSTLLLNTDLGEDAVYAYRLDPDTGRLTQTARLAVHPGAGPRHLAYHPAVRLVYVICELDFTLITCAWSATTGELTVADERSAVEDGTPGSDFCSAIRVSADGRFLYVATRGPDTISVFSLADAAAPRPVTTVASGGAWPRDFALTGSLLLCANQNGNAVTVLRVDPATGIPAATGAALSIPAPTCVLVPDS